MSNAIRKICNTVLSVVLICSGVAGTALGAEEFPSSEGLFVSTLKLNLTQADRNGDSRAKENLRVLQSLDARDLQKLESILEWGPEFSQLPSDSEVAPKLLDDGIVNHEVTTYAFQGVDTKMGCLAWEPLGISVTEVCTGGTYRSSNGLAISIDDARAYVAHNYQPFSDIRMEDANGWVSGGAAWFKSTVTVVRGPIPRLGGNLSTHSGIHTVMVVPTGNFVGYNTIADR
ncbi:MAG: hypothetical protein SPK00_08210 [Corynebacterium glucuronolyticum]|nr:hypothetical protein [Mycobacteriaceae bacterium]MDY5834715.1 hypothetical protein [Corynebacterium glucuronolyticum]